MHPSPAEMLFWLSCGLLFYTFIGYPLLLLLLAKLIPSPIRSLPHTPHVSLIIAAHNEQDRITSRLTNLLASDYPPGCLEIVLVLDGCTDDTATLARAFPAQKVKVLENTQKLGKADCLNRGVALAHGDVLVFTDVRQTFPPDTIRKLVASLADERIGAVSGSLEIATPLSGTGKGIAAYWNLEKAIRYAEAQIDSCIGCTGAIYALRRSLYKPIPPDTVLDDVVIPMQALLSGHRVAFEPAAQAFDPQPLEPSLEARRKTRTLAGNYQMLFRYPSWLSPFSNRAWWQLISHKYLRLAGPFFLITILVSNFVICNRMPYGIFLAAQLALYVAILLQALFHTTWKPLKLPAGFLFLNLMSLAGLWHFIRHDPARGWKQSATRTTS